MPHFHHFSICNQNQSISNLVIFEQNTKAIALLFGQKCLIFITFQSAIKINQFQIWYNSLTLWPKIPQFHHFSICNQNQSISNLVIFEQNTKAIALLFGQKCLIFITFPICNLKSAINQSNEVIFEQNTKAIALLFGQKCLIFITFHLQLKPINFKCGHF